jgi:hypothetical protein
MSAPDEALAEDDQFVARNFLLPEFLRVFQLIRLCNRLQSQADGVHRSDLFLADRADTLLFDRHSADAFGNEVASAVLTTIGANGLSQFRDELLAAAREHPGMPAQFFGAVRLHDILRFIQADGLRLRQQIEESLPEGHTLERTQHGWAVNYPDKRSCSLATWFERVKRMNAGTDARPPDEPSVLETLLR